MTRNLNTFTSDIKQIFREIFLKFRFEIRVFHPKNCKKCQYWEKRYQTISANQSRLEKVQVATFIQNF